LGTEVPRCWADPAKYKRITVGTRCSAALEFFVIDPSGFVRVCNHSQVRLHHFDDIEKVKLDPYWTTFTQRRYLPKECGGCRDAADCDGGCREAAHIVGGKIDSPDTLPPVPRNL
jgi:radical SAM protein with 4Fe4S-binding SPASM domain